MKLAKTLNAVHWLYKKYNYSRERLKADVLLQSTLAKILVLILFIVLVSFSSSKALGSNFEISGNVYLDENENGVRDHSENEGIQGVLINIFDDSETLISSTNTDEDGNYSFENIVESETCRLEFVLSGDLENQYAASHYGDNNGTFIQFVTVGNQANLAVKLKHNNCIEEIPTNITNVVPWGPTTKKTLLDHGVGAVTCSAYPLDPVDHRYVMGLINLPDVEPTVDPVGSASVEPSYPGMFHHPDWVANKMGNVLGLEIDEAFNMYVTASSQIWQRASNAGGDLLTEQDVLNVWRYGNIGGGADDLAAAGTIYKIDAYTGKASVFAQLPQQNASLFYYGDAGYWERTSGPGLGNLTYDNNHKSFYVTNFEDGKIYHLNEDGDIIGSYDPFESDDETAGFAPLGERIWGIDIYESKLYFSVWNSTTLDNPYNGDPEVYSIELNEDGSFIGNEKFEFAFTIPNYPVLYSPIADIEINASGRMLIAQRTMLNNVTVYNHQSATAIYDLNTVTNTWEQTSSLRVGHSGPSEGYGGAAWDPSRDMVWMSSADINAGYGPHGLMGVPTHQFTPDFLQANEWAVVPYTPPGSQEDVKGFGGDIALADINLYNNCKASEIEVGNYIWEDLNGDGIQGADESALEGITIELINENMMLVGQAVSNDKGQYYFNQYNVDVNGINVSPSGLILPNSGAYTGIDDDAIYYVVVGKGQATKDQLTLNDVLYELTSAKEGENELIDSDGISDNNMFEGRPYHQLTTGHSGDNNHNYDFGWRLIEPLDFDATAVDNSYAFLEWLTLQEVNSEYFEVQRSIDTTNWEDIEHVSGADFSIEDQYYTLNDLDPYMGVSYYRLKWFDFDETYVYSEIREVEFTLPEPEPPVIEDNGITFPNPATEYLPIDFGSADFLGAKIDIYRADGALMWRGKTLENYTNIDISQFAAGTYVLVMHINDTEQIIVEKLIIRNK